MLKGILGFLLFAFFLIVFIVMLTWGFLVRTFRSLMKQAQDAADRQEKQYRDETGRQRQQYGYRPQSSQSTQSSQATESSQSADSEPQRDAEPQPRRTATATGETIIDHRHQKREGQKIFDDSDGEYVEFTEVKD